MTISGVGGSQQPSIDPQKGEAIKEYGLIIGKIGSMQRQFLDLSKKLTDAGGSKEYPAAKAKLEGLLKEIDTIQKQLKSMQDTGQLNYIFGDRTAAGKALHKTYIALNSAGEHLQDGLRTAPTGSNPAGALGSSLDYVTGALDTIVKLS